MWIFDLILLENDSLQFFYQGLKWRCFSIKMTLRLINLYFCALDRNFDRPKVQKSPGYIVIFSIFKLTCLLRYRLDFCHQGIRREIFATNIFSVKFVSCIFDQCFLHPSDGKNHYDCASCFAFEFSELLISIYFNLLCWVIRFTATFLAKCSWSLEKHLQILNEFIQSLSRILISLLVSNMSIWFCEFVTLPAMS